MFAATILILALLGPVVHEIVEYYNYNAGGEAVIPRISRPLVHASENLMFNWHLYLLAAFLIPVFFTYLSIRGSNSHAFAQNLAQYFQPRPIKILTTIVILISLTIILLILALSSPLLIPPEVIW